MKVYLLAFLITATLLLALVPVLEPTPQNLSQNTLGNTQPSQTFINLRDTAPSSIKQAGAQTVLSQAQTAFKSGKITMFECHTLTHLIGHHSPIDFPSIKPILDKFGPNFCEGGYIHGLESEIVLSHPDDFPQELSDLCAFFRESYPRITCYHGAGHTFMRQTLDVPEALKLCESLVYFENSHQMGCYTGVFSELTNIIGGIDGDTGFPLSAEVQIKLDSNPMDYCSSLSPTYQVACALELNGLNISPSSTEDQIESLMLECTSNSYSLDLQAACLRSVSAVAAQHQLPTRQTVLAPQFVLQLPQKLRRAYIDGVGIEMAQNIINGSPKDWKVFCSQFNDPEDQDFCQTVINSIQ